MKIGKHATTIALIIAAAVTGLVFFTFGGGITNFFFPMSCPSPLYGTIGTPTITSCPPQTPPTNFLPALVISFFIGVVSGLIVVKWR